MTIKEVKTIALIGPYPEPTGGVSIHIYRLSEILNGRYDVNVIDESRKIKPSIFNIRTMNFIEYLRILSRSEIVHIHSGVPILRFLHVVVSYLLRKKIILTLHSYRVKNFFWKLVDKVAFRLADKVVSVSQEVADIIPVESTVIPAYLPPQPSENFIPNGMLSVLEEARRNNFKVLCSNASKLADYNGSDLYGFDQIVRLFLSASVAKKWIAILNVSAVDGCFTRYQSLKEFIVENRLENNIYLFDGPLNFCALMRQTDLYIRATLTDGDSISVREALSLGVPVIASNCVARPHGVVLYDPEVNGQLSALVSESAFLEVQSESSFEKQVMSLYS